MHVVSNTADNLLFLLPFRCIYWTFQHSSLSRLFLWWTVIPLRMLMFRRNIHITSILSLALRSRFRFRRRLNSCQLLRSRIHMQWISFLLFPVNVSSRSRLTQNNHILLILIYDLLIILLILSALPFAPTIAWWSMHFYVFCYVEIQFILTHWWTKNHLPQFMLLFPLTIISLMHFALIIQSLVLLFTLTIIMSLMFFVDSIWIVSILITILI